MENGEVVADFITH